MTTTPGPDQDVTVPLDTAPPPNWLRVRPTIVPLVWWLGWKHQEGGRFVLGTRTRAVRKAKAVCARRDRADARYGQTTVVTADG